jgi:hypothetical protein
MRVKDVEFNLTIATVAKAKVGPPADYYKVASRKAASNLVRRNICSKQVSGVYFRWSIVHQKRDVVEYRATDDDGTFELKYGTKGRELSVSKTYSPCGHVPPRQCP